MESNMKSSYYLIFISLFLLAGCSSHGDASAQSQSNGMAVAKASLILPSTRRRSASIWRS